MGNSRVESAAVCPPIKWVTDVAKLVGHLQGKLLEHSHADGNQTGLNSLEQINTRRDNLTFFVPVVIGPAIRPRSAPRPPRPREIPPRPRMRLPIANDAPPRLLTGPARVAPVGPVFMPLARYKEQKRLAS